MDQAQKDIDEHNQREESVENKYIENIQEFSLNRFENSENQIISIFKANECKDRCKEPQKIAKLVFDAKMNALKQNIQNCFALHAATDIDKKKKKITSMDH